MTVSEEARRMRAGIALFHAGQQMHIERLRREHPAATSKDLVDLANNENRERLGVEWGEPTFSPMGESVLE
jgi:Rv0078B-related antitoxin